MDTHVHPNAWKRSMNRQTQTVGIQTQFRASKTHALDMQKMCVVYKHAKAPRPNSGSFQDFDSVHVDIGYRTPTLPSGSLLFILNNSWLKGSGIEPQMKSLILPQSGD